MKLIPAVQSLSPKERSFRQRLDRVLHVSGRNWQQAVMAVVTGDKQQEQHLWRRFCQHERAKRNCL